MQNPKWVIGLGTAFVLMTILSGILEGVYGMESTLLHRLMNPELSWGGVWDYIKVLWAILWFDYSFFYGWFMIFRFLFMCVSIGLIASLVVEVFLRIRIPGLYGN